MVLERTQAASSGKHCSVTGAVSVMPYITCTFVITVRKKNLAWKNLHWLCMKKKTLWVRIVIFADLI